MKRTFAALCCALFASSQFAQAQDSPVRAYSQKTLLKNWALSRCLAELAADPSDRDDAGAAAGAYLEFGKQPIEAYEEIHKLVAEYAARDYKGVAKSRFNTMKCIDLFHSKELDMLAAKYAKAR